MQKHASSSEKQYLTIFAPLPILSDEILYFDKKSVFLPCDEDFPMLHYHDRYEIGVCESGEGLFLSEGIFYSVSKGDFIFVAPERCHYSRSLNCDAPCVCRFSYIHAKTVERLISLAAMENGKSNATFRNTESSVPAVIRMSEHPKIADLLFRIMDLCKSESHDTAALAALTLSVFLLEAQNIFANTRLIASASQRTDDVVAKISEYLSLHYDRSDTARELADKCHLSGSQLRRRFIAMYGMPPIAYRNFLRCKIAAELLIRSIMPIAEISERIGYTAASDFYRAFKKTYGVSPAAYRLNNKL